MPSITWYKDDKLVKKGNIIAAGTMLQLHEITSNDEGDYKCLAQNIVGEDQHEFSLTVLVNSSL
jgi:hypothetical protein